MFSESVTTTTVNNLPQRGLERLRSTFLRLMDKWFKEKDSALYHALWKA